MAVKRPLVGINNPTFTAYDEAAFMGPEFDKLWAEQGCPGGICPVVFSFDVETGKATVHDAKEEGLQPVDPGALDPDELDRWTNEGGSDALPDPGPEQD